MFTLGGLVAGVIAAFICGISKTGIPGASLVAVPLVGLIVDGRQIPGAILPLLIVADLFAIAWYQRHARWDVLRDMSPWLGVGFVLGIGFFVVVGSATRLLEQSIGAILLLIVVVELLRLYREIEPWTGRVALAGYGTSGGFTTFVANAAGPALNTYLAGIRLPKAELLGTAAWLYFILNISKIPFYLGLGAWSEGGAFFTRETLLWNGLVLPGVFAGVYVGRVIAARISQRVFLLAVLGLAGAGALALIL